MASTSWVPLRMRQEIVCAAIHIIKKVGEETEITHYTSYKRPKRPVRVSSVYRGQGIGHLYESLQFKATHVGFKLDF